MSSANELPIPGSIILLDNQAEIVLSPAPSNDVNDPLRWSWRRKQIAHLMLVVYTMSIGISTAALYSVLVPIEEATGIPLGTLNAGTGYMFLLLGWGGLITQPLAMTFGKRPIYLISSLLSVAIVVWMPYIRTEGEWLANKVLQGLIASPVEMLIEVSIADMFYAHERGLYMGLYAFTLFSSNYIAPMIAGWIAQLHGYQWVFYFCAIQQGIGFLILLFFMEETNYSRGTTELSDAQAEHVAPVVATPVHTDKDHVYPNISSAPEPATGVMVGTPLTLVQKMKMFDQRWATNGQLFRMTYQPVLLLRYPCVFWAGFAYGAALVWYNVLNATASLIFSGAPYNFSSGFVGLTYIGPLIGVFFAGLWSGWFGDRFMIWLVRRKRGVREPEDRLWLMSLPVILCPAALILWGVGAANGVHWSGLVVGGGMSACCSAIAAGLSLNYAIDCYKDIGGEVMISVILVRNTLSFAVGYGITPWLTIGIRNTFISAAFVGMIINATFLIVIKWGKSWRRASKVSYWKHVEKMGGSH